MGWGWGWVELLPTRNPDLPMGPTAMPCSLGLMVRRAMSFLWWTHCFSVLKDVAPGSPDPSWPFTAQVSPPPSHSWLGKLLPCHRWRGGHR